MHNNTLFKNINIIKMQIHLK
jgi:hypothetical protein